MKGYTHPDANEDGSDNDYHVGNDADTLQKHAEITADPDRHAAAHQELQDRQQKGKQAIASSKKHMHGKVKQGLAKAFGKTPFQQAGENGKTPFEEAGK